MTHPPIEQVEQLLAGTLDTNDTEWIIDHLEGCEDCRWEVKQLLLLRRLRERQQRTRRRRALAAAAAVVLLSSAVVAYSLNYASSRAPELASADAAPAAPNDFATTEPLAQLFVDFYLRGPDSMSTADGFDHGHAGVQAIVERRYDDAVEHLQQAYRDRPSRDHAAYLGIALYLQGDDSELVEQLLEQGRQARAELVSQEATWFLGNLHLRRGDTTLAVDTLATIAELNGRPARRARALLETLATR